MRRPSPGRRSPRTPPSPSSPGRAQEQLDRTSDAEQSYKTALELDPGNVEAGLQLARLQLRQRHFAEAKAPLAALARAFPHGPAGPHRAG